MSKLGNCYKGDTLDNSVRSSPEPTNPGRILLLNLRRKWVENVDKQWSEAQFYLHLITGWGYFCRGLHTLRTDLPVTVNGRRDHGYTDLSSFCSHSVPRVLTKVLLDTREPKTGTGDTHGVHPLSCVSLNTETHQGPKGTLYFCNF